MLKRFFIIPLILFVAAIALFISCSKSGEDEADKVDFDKTAMLTHLANEIIIPQYASLQSKVNSFKTTADAFIAAANTVTQAAALVAYKQMHLQYQNVEAFNSVGPAYTKSFEAYINFFGALTATDINLNGFSINTSTIENNISSGSYNLEDYSNSNFYAQGFGAVRYLFFSPDALNKFSSNTEKRKKYAADVVNRIKTLTDEVVTDWNTYKNDFITNTNITSGSPISALVNQMAYEMDALKGPRIGWPFGKKSGGQIFKEKVEGYYVGNSVALATANLKNLKKLYTAGGSGKGFSDYLIALGKGSLNNEVTAQFDVAISKIEAIPDPLSESLTTHSTQVNAAYGEIQKLLTLLKTDVASALGVQISFVDNDGD